MSGWYGSVQNRIAERCKSPEPVIGMGATELMWSDRNAFEVIAVKDARHITVRRMKATVKEGTDWLAQEYDLTSDENGYTVNLFQKKNGQWVERSASGCYGSKFALGYASEYRDPSF